MPRASRTVLFLITDREEWNALAAVKYACANILEPSRDAVTFVFSRMEQGAAMHIRRVVHRDKPSKPPAWCLPSITDEINKLGLTTPPSYEEIISHLSTGEALAEWLATKSAVEHNPPTLAILGSRGRTGIVKLALGSISSTVVEAAVAPCLVVKASLPAAAAVAQRLIGVAVDGSALGHALCAWVAETLLRPGDRVALLHGRKDVAAHPQAMHKAAAEEAATGTGDAAAKAVTDAWRRVSSPEEPSVHVTYFAIAGAPGPAIVSWATSHSPTVLVVGSRAGTTSTGAALTSACKRLGSVSSHVTAHAPCAVLVVDGPRVAKAAGMPASVAPVTAPWSRSPAEE